MPINLNEVTKILNIDIPDWVEKSDRDSILKEVGDFLINEVISYTESGVSPVEGFGKFPKLNKQYADTMKAGDTTSNLDLNGDMLASLTFEIVNGKIKIGIFDEDQAKKAFNHNTGDTLPKRPFIPTSDESFDPDIMSGVDDLVSGFINDLDYNPKNDLTGG
jgi:hypothetical protein